MQLIPVKMTSDVTVATGFNEMTRAKKDQVLHVPLIFAEDIINKQQGVKVHPVVETRYEIRE